MKKDRPTISDFGHLRLRYRHMLTLCALTSEWNFRNSELPMYFYGCVIRRSKQSVVILISLFYSNIGIVKYSKILLFSFCFYYSKMKTSESEEKWRPHKVTTTTVPCQMSPVQFPLTSSDIKQKIRMLQSTYPQCISITEAVYGAEIFLEKQDPGHRIFFLFHTVERGWKLLPFNCPVSLREKVTNVVCKTCNYFRDRNCKAAVVDSFPQYSQQPVEV